MRRRLDLGRIRWCVLDESFRGCLDCGRVRIERTVIWVSMDRTIIKEDGLTAIVLAVVSWPPNMNALML